MVVCGNCGRENPAGARFCNACASELRGTGAREVRKTVTVLFVDVTGSTALGERLDPESFRRVMARFFETARGSLERHGGTVEKFIGDAVMAAFGVPTVHEDDALRALRAAAELRDSLAPLNDELEREYGVSLQLRTGINTGEVVTGTDERLVTGDAVNVAARLEQAADPGEILIGEETRRLTRSAIEVEPVEPLALKGKSIPLAAYRLLRVVQGAPAFERRLDAAFVGRRNEIAQVRSAFDEAVAARSARLVTVLGPPGIGKSRLARELTAVLADEAVVLTGRCLPYGDGITYWPLVEMFRAAGAENELEAALTAGTPEEIFWSVRKALERHARRRPLVLVLEDIHWAEPTLLDLLEHLADWTRDAPILLLCLARPELIDVRPAWGGRPMTLEPLSAVESEELIEDLLGGSGIEASTRARIRDVSEGNPLFVEQLLAMVAEGGEIGRVPPTIQALLAARLDTLPEAERNVLERASVIGLEFDWEALGELAPDRRRPSGTQLAALVRHELIRPHETVEDTFRFRHMLIRDAAYSRLPKERRSALHERFADWLDARGEEYEELVGYHLEQAFRWVVELGPADERARSLAHRAADHLAASARRATGRGDGPAAASLLERATAVLDPGDPQRLRLLPSLGRALRDAGQLDRADAVLSEAVDRGRAADQPLAAEEAAVALADLRFHRATVVRDEVVREVERAARVFGQYGDKAGLARALTLGGKLSFWRGSAAEALIDLEQAARHAAEAGDRGQEAEILANVLTVLQSGPTPVVEALARVEEMQGRAEGSRRLEIAMLDSRARFEAMQGRFEAARTNLSRAIALAEDGLPAVRWAGVASSVGFVEVLAGNLAGAEPELRRACEELERIGEFGYLSSAGPLLLDVLYMQGRDEEALPLSERWRPERLTVPEDVDAHAASRRVRAKLLARRGAIEEAEALAREATAIAAPTDFLPLRADVAADLAVVLGLAGRAQEAAAALDEAIRLHEMKGNVAAARTLRGGLAEAPSPRH